jgi:hypothetical protein
VLWCAGFSCKNHVYSLQQFGGVVRKHEIVGGVRNALVGALQGQDGSAAALAKFLYESLLLGMRKRVTQNE